MIELPGTYDVLTARIAEMLGFDGVYVGSSNVAASDFGVPDVGIVSMAEFVDHARRVVSAVDVPVFIDLDDAGGTPLQVQRTVRSAEQAGVAGFHIEDVDCSVGKHLAGNANRTGADGDGDVPFAKEIAFERDRLLPIARAVDNIKAAVDARQNPDTVIAARTDALVGGSLAEAIDRAGSYADAGADVVFLCYLRASDVKVVTEAISTPLMNFVGVAPTPEERRDCEDGGLRILLYPVPTMFAAFNAVWNTLRELKDTGMVADVDGLMANRDLYLEAVRVAEWTERAGRD